MPSAAMTISGWGEGQLLGCLSRGVFVYPWGWGCSGGLCVQRGVYPNVQWADTPRVDRILDTRLQKYYLSTTSVVDDNKGRAACSVAAGTGSTQKYLVGLPAV